MLDFLQSFRNLTALLRRKWGVVRRFGGGGVRECTFAFDSSPQVRSFVFLFDRPKPLGQALKFSTPVKLMFVEVYLGFVTGRILKAVLPESEEVSSRTVS